MNMVWISYIIKNIIEKIKESAIIMLFLKVIVNLNKSFIDNINSEIPLRGSGPIPCAESSVRILFFELYLILTRTKK